MNRFSWIVLGCSGLLLFSCAKRESSAPSSAEEPLTADEAPKKEQSPPAAQPPAPLGEESKRKRDDSREEEAPSSGAKQRAAAEKPGRLLDDEAATFPDDVNDAMELLGSAFSRLDQALTLSTPDCSTASTLRDRVCDLAEHICRLADDSPSPHSQTLCTDGRSRCESAKNRFAESCPTP